MADEQITRLQAECSHEFQISAQGRMCQKCQLKWETWAEIQLYFLSQRLELIEENLCANEDEEQAMNVTGFYFVTLLPPQTSTTCSTCNGTGQLPFFDGLYHCYVCDACYPNLEAVTDAAHRLPCLHFASNAYYSHVCPACAGSGAVPPLTA